MPFTVEEFRDMVRILEERPEWREELRRLLLTDELLRLPAIVRELAERLSALTERVDTLAGKVDALVEWQRGEAGRREGERYERRIVRDAPYLFGGGDGGATDDPIVRAKLSEWLQPIFQVGKALEPNERPTLADLIWWKDAWVLVVGASLKVNGSDVLRAYQRAQTLRSVGVNATAVVVGEDWANLEARELAKEKGVEWAVGNILSEGLLTFRRLLMEAKEGLPAAAIFLIIHFSHEALRLGSSARDQLHHRLAVVQGGQASRPRPAAPHRHHPG